MLAAASLLAAAGAASGAWAAETIDYRYDARGRLVKVERSGTVNNNLTTQYAYDKADNRLSRSTATPLSFSIADTSATEGAFIYFTVTRSGQTGLTCSVGYGTADGTATHPADYNGASSYLSFAPGETSKVLSIRTHADGITEGSETMRMLLSSPGCGATITRAEAIGTINDP